MWSQRFIPQRSMAPPDPRAQASRQSLEDILAELELAEMFGQGAGAALGRQPWQGSAFTGTQGAGMMQPWLQQRQEKKKLLGGGGGQQGGGGMGFQGLL